MNQFNSGVSRLAYVANANIYSELVQTQMLNT